MTVERISPSAPSSMRTPEIEVVLASGTMRARIGTPVGALLPKAVDGSLVIAALVDQKAVSLTEPLMSGAAVGPLTTASPDGQRCYRQSQALLLLEAVHRVAPTLGVQLSYSLGFAQRVVLSPPPKELTQVLGAIEAEMLALVKADAPLRGELCTVKEARKLFEAKGWSDARDLLSIHRGPLVELVSYGHEFVLRPGPLAPSTGLLGGARLTTFGEELLLVFGPEAARRTRARNISRETGRHAAVLVANQTEAPTQAQERWLTAVGLSSVGAFNAACIRGDVGEIIRVSEGFQEKRVGAIADQILALADRVKVVAVAGPSSSGKTTFIKRLRVQLQVNGLNPIGLSLDDYYCDRDATPRDAAGALDFEAFEALRHDLLRGHVTALLAGERVATSHYDFVTGKSSPEGGPTLSLGPRDLLMVEGIHGLNPQLFESVRDDAVFRIFICPLTQLPFDRLSRVHVSDVRLLRRIIRDRHRRGTVAADNIARWPSVRAGESEHIFPFQGNADAVFDSSLVYELAVLKVYAERYLLEVPEAHPSRATALRLLELTDRFVAIYPDHVPPTSLLREFIGGSAFED